MEYPQTIEVTAKLKADINGLLELGQGMTRLVRGYKLLQNLYSQDMATGEVESLVRKRRQQRDKIFGKMSVKRKEQIAKTTLNTRKG